MDLSGIESEIDDLNEAFGSADSAPDDESVIIHLRHLANCAESVMEKARSLIEESE